MIAPRPRLAPRSLLWRTISRRARRLVRQPLERLIARPPDTVVGVPPLDDAFVAAVKRIAPQYDWMDTGETSRAFWEQDQNRSCWSEDAALAPVFARMPPPRRILELGPGLGRSAAFFAKRHFPEAHFDLFDATGHDLKYELMGNRYSDSFCGDLAVLERCVRFNGVASFQVIDANQHGGHLHRPAEPYDLIYSFYSVGFHWSIDHWLDEILALCHDHTLCAFLVPSQYEPSTRIAALPHVVLEGAPALRPRPWDTVYVLAFTPARVPWLPAWPASPPA